jgi:hypothetical protein
VNTFATLLLAFPFYLAIKGKLATYITLAKPASGSAANAQASTASAPTANALGTTAVNTAPATTAALPSSTDMSSVVSNVTHIFGDVASITELA